MVKKLQIKLLGEVTIQKEGKSVKGLPSRAAEALLIYLACTLKPVSREKLAELLWTDRTTAQSLTNLRTILSSLRRELGEYLLVERDTLAFNLQSDFSLDIAEFERQLKDLGLASRAAPSLDPPALQKLSLALDLYRGDFLEGFSMRDGLGFEEWSLLQREHFRQLAISGFRTLTLACLENGLYPEGLDAASRWSRLDPYDEEACRAQMWLHLRLGQRAAALQCYQTLKTKLAQDLNVAPVPATADLYCRLRDIEVPPAVSLPAASAKFIGRERELAELETLLITPLPRLVTVTGTGGVGKTRLVVEAARCISQKLPGRFLHGIRFIPLETIQTADEIPQRVADAIGFSFRGVEPPARQLLAYLSGQEHLLILDNFEHLLDEEGRGIAFVVELLREAPQVKVIITSRERLNLYDEVVFDLRGLEMPKEGAPVEGSDAMRLFLQGARRVRHGFALSGDEARQAASICNMVDGVPLAIELASAWTRHHACAEIAAWIAKDLDFLKSPFADAPDRHRSLRAVFERSWSLLAAEEQAAFAQLSVFHGGFTQQAAEAVIGRASILAALEDKSLVQRQAAERFFIHPLLQQYAAEKRSALPDAGEAENRHSAYYLDFVTALGDGEAPASRANIRPERDNLRAALAFAARQGQVQALEGAVGILHSFFSVESGFQEGIDLFQMILDTLGESAAEADGLRCELLARQARMRTQIGQMEQARADLRGALAALASFDDPSRRSRVLDSLAITHYYAGDYPQAGELAQESLSLSEKLNNTDGVAFSLNFLGSCAKAQGNYIASREYFQKAAAAYRLMNDEIGAGMVLNNLGNLLQAQGDFAGAQSFYVEASGILKAQNHIHGAATTLVNAGKLALKRGEGESARRLLEEGLEMKRQINDMRGQAIALAALGDLALSVHQEADAAERLRAALELARPTGDALLILDILTAIAALMARQGRMDLARRLLAYVAAHSGTIEETRQQVSNLVNELGKSENDWAQELVEDVAEAVLREW